MARAAVMTGAGAPLEIVDLEVEAPRNGEVLVRMAASGICHTDKAIVDGHLPYQPPIVLGHEGAGIVEAVGEGVDGFAEGDHVVLSWTPQCGSCFYCTHGQAQFCEIGTQHQLSGTLLDGTHRFHREGAPVSQLGYLGTFSELSVIPESALVRISHDVPLDAAALIGCGVLTGTGAAMKTASIRTGETVTVVGCGGVGLNAVQGARLAGAERVVAVDTNAAKLELAKLFGATDLVDASAGDPVAAVREATGGMGTDVGIEVVGAPATLGQITQMTRKGGRIVLVGMPPFDVLFPTPVAAMYMTGQSIHPSTYGEADFRIDVPRLLERYIGGELRLDELVGRRIALDDVNDALTSLDSSDVARNVIVY